MQIIPLSAVPSQTASVTLAGRSCRMNVYQKSLGLFLDLYQSDSLVIAGVLCLTRVMIVRDSYLGFSGDLVFYDQQGSDDPNYAGLGSRWVLAYVGPWMT
jgi:hypothetical protein